ncbi:MAG: glycosyltransferase [Polyangiaceae bacterium]|nr:glycosyltransferase [Polyangiaceae bacterium]
MSKKTLIFIPTFNERENVGPMCEQILALGMDADLIFMDDNSPDGTGQLLDNLAAQHPRVKVMHRTGKLGVGSAHMAGIQFAYAEGYERLITLDCDFTHSPSLIPAFLKRCDTADIVLGSRYMQNASLPGWSFFRKTLTVLGHTLTKTLLGISEDATGAFRVYNLETIPRGLFDLVQSRGYAFFFESLLVLSRNECKIAELPIALPARTYGSSKMSLTEIQRSVQTLGTLYYEDLTNPTRFLVKTPQAALTPGLLDPQNWNEYWDKKSAKSTAAYDVIATFYRNAVIRRGLTRAITAEFAPNAALLHAGCGSGQVDGDLHRHARITAIDISPSALNLYRQANPGAKATYHASIFDLPFENGTFDGAYNLGVVEHFTRDELARAFSELHRVIKPGGKLVIFWPHAYATSVMVLGSAHFLLNDVLHRNVRLHPPEVSLVHSREEAAELLALGGFELTSYRFGARDLFVQAVVVAKRV